VWHDRRVTADPAQSDPRLARLRLTAEHAALEIAPGVGGRVAALEVDGWDLLRRHGWTDHEWGAFVMAPWIGRLRQGRASWAGRTWQVPPDDGPHAIHGTVLAAQFTVTEAGATRARLEAPLGPDWPFPGRVVQIVELAPKQLRLRLELHADREPMPGILGWHPWFHRRASRVADVGVQTGDVAVVVHSAYRVELDAHGLPTGEVGAPPKTPLDDVLLNLIAPPVVRWPGGPTLALHSPEAEAWIVYTEHPDGVCVEPVTGLPDGLNGGLLGEPPVARPGRPLTATFEIAWG
jgi:galactose mutarotase-like enzyme